MTRNHSLITILAILALTFALTACEKEGPAEKAGKEIDQAMEKTKEKVEQTIDKVDNEGPAENAGEALDEASEKAKKEAQKLKENAEETMKN